MSDFESGGFINACPHGTFINSWCPRGCDKPKGEPFGVVTEVDRENKTITVSRPKK